MTRVGWWKSFAVLLALVLAVPVAAAPLPADKSALAQIPATSPLVVYVHGFEGSTDRLLVYIKNALPDLAPFAEIAIKKMLEDGIEERKFRGLVKEGPVFLAFSEMPKDEEPKFAAVFAVTDYKAFRDGILKEEERKALKADPKGYESTTVDGKPVYFLQRKGYAVVTQDEKTALAYTKMPAGLDTKISTDQAAKLLTGDLGFYLSMDVVNKDYAEQIKTAKESIEEALKTAEEGLGKNQRGMIEAARNLVGPLFQAIEDSKGVLLTVEFRPTALVLHVQSELRPNTKTAALLKTYKPVDLESLDRSPAGQVFYTALMTNPEMFKLLGPLAIGASGEPDGKGGKAMKAAVEAFAKAGPGARLDVAGLPASGVQLWQFAEPAKALAAQALVLDNLSKGDTFASGMLKEPAVLKKGAGKYKDLSFDAVTLVWDLEKMAGATGGTELPEEVQKKMAEGFKKFLGEKTTIWIGADDKQLITVTASDWKSATALLDKQFSGTGAVGQKTGYQQARKEMPNGATLVGLVDIVAYGTAITEVVRPILGGFGFNLPDKYPAALPTGNPSFVGSAVTLDEKRIGFDLVITATAVNDVYKAFVVPFRGGF